jgi:hypothetical protein
MRRFCRKALRAFVARNGPLDHFVCLRQTAPHPLDLLTRYARRSSPFDVVPKG